MPSDVEASRALGRHRPLRRRLHVARRV